ncbi:AAA-like domain-containing protein [Nostoc sp. UCD121]|uniref:AAA-like domain-containing protein n=1 Tax=unclassified Nostoc TaxID=2593658 RepID=UPI0016238BA3|nr:MULTISPECIES: AAA-like domain-containing protein [unclassified Nostoc]MBC1223182.1 AAA-like domain-containing protein [Nostoc sp. UCD120]MBC1278726.1 AAA-like domain-containing protein [Nostoc sp. UCD121]MBC1295121.1 AAA-like domain-containing protein [Nostoc sp. UCD122]
MDFETALKILDAAVVTQTKRHLKDIEVTILRSSWQGKKYDEIAQTHSYTTEYLQHDVGPKLWQMLSAAFGEKVGKKNFQAALERQRISWSTASSKQLEAISQPQKLMSSSQLTMEKMTSNNSVSEESNEALLSIYTNEQPLLNAEPELPVGQVPISSSFYVERPPIEDRCFQEILQPGSLIRIKAPRQMGKTSLMARILDEARQHSCQTVSISFHLADKAVFANLDTFLRWFCESVGRKLKQLHQLDDYWSIYGSKDKTTAYFEECLLEEIDSPLVISLDGVDRIFPYRDTAEDFFNLLRAWYEYAKYGDRSSELWKKLRLVLVHSKEVHIPLNINQSPFNVGLSIELQDFTPEQVQILVARHPGLNWTDTQIKKLMDMVGGQPYLIRLALYHVQHRYISLEQLLQTAPTEAAIYQDHLRGHLCNLEHDPKLVTAFSQVVKSLVPIELDSESAFKLHSMGLVVYCNHNKLMPRCDLYRQYFQNRLM